MCIYEYICESHRFKIYIYVHTYTQIHIHIITYKIYNAYIYIYLYIYTYVYVNDICICIHICICKPLLNRGKKTDITTFYCIWSIISSFSNLNRWPSSLGLFYHVPLKRDQGDWDSRLRIKRHFNFQNAIRGTYCMYSESFRSEFQTETKTGLNQSH